MDWFEESQQLNQTLNVKSVANTIHSVFSSSKESPIIFKKNLDLLYKVKGSGMMKAGKLCVSAVFRPVPSAANSGKYACAVKID